MFQFTVRAEDAGTPNLFDTADVVLTITESPGISFFPAEVTIPVNETIALGSLIERVQASNGGVNVSKEGNLFLY